MEYIIAYKQYVKVTNDIFISKQNCLKDNEDNTLIAIKNKNDLDIATQKLDDIKKILINNSTIRILKDIINKYDDIKVQINIQYNKIVKFRLDNIIKLISKDNDDKDNTYVLLNIEYNQLINKYDEYKILYKFYINDIQPYLLNKFNDNEYLLSLNKK